MAGILGLASDKLSAQLTPEHVARVQWVGVETAISPDGRWIAYTRSLAAGHGGGTHGRVQDLLLIAAAGGEPQEVVPAGARPAAPAWSPDGALLAFTAEFPERNSLRQVYAVAPPGREPRALTDAQTSVGAFAFSPDGRSLAYLAAESQADSTMDRQRDGVDAIVYDEPGPHVRLWVKDLAGGVPRPLTPSDRTVRAFAWSPDGKVLALQVLADRGARRSIADVRLYAVRAEGRDFLPLARTEGPPGPMAWSPDGKWLAFVGAESRRDPAAQSLFVVPAGGGEPLDLTAGYQGSAYWVEWLEPERLLFGAIEGTRAVLNRVSRTGGRIERIVGGGIESFVFLGSHIDTGLSLDARARTFAASMDTPSQADELYVGTTDGRQLRRLTSHNAAIERVRFARQEIVEWTAADGLRIEGILIHPLDETPGARYPLVVIAHGGPHFAVRHGFVTSPQEPGQVFAARGYAVLYPNYRGSLGRGVAFARAIHRDTEIKELDDIIRGIDHLVAGGLVDPKRVAIQGFSYGGYLAALAAGLHSDRFRAAMASAPVTNWNSFIPSHDPVHNSLAHWDLWWYEHPAFFSARSPVTHVHANWTPLHFDHGLKDPQSYRQSEELYQALRFAGVETRLVVYPREPHDYVEEAHRIDVVERYLAWLDRHMGAASYSRKDVR